MAIPEESTRSRLLDAAESLFAERGYEATGIREIADRAGVNLSGIKYHFGSKRGLYLETIRRAMDQGGSAQAWSVLERAPSGPDAAAEVFREFVRRILGALLSDEHSTRGCLVMHCATEPGDATDLVVDEFIRPHHEQLIKLIGVLRPESTREERSRSAQFVMGQILHQRVFRAFLDRLEPESADGRGALDALADQITFFSLNGMGCERALVARAMSRDAVAAGDHA